MDHDQATRALAALYVLGQLTEDECQTFRGCMKESEELRLMVKEAQMDLDRLEADHLHDSGQAEGRDACAEQIEPLRINYNLAAIQRGFN